jgi:hypothetical protein
MSVLEPTKKKTMFTKILLSGSSSCTNSSKRWITMLWPGYDIQQKQAVRFERVLARSLFGERFFAVEYMASQGALHLLIRFLREYRK